MKKMEKYLANVLGEEIFLQQFEIRSKLPLFLQNEYDFFSCKIHNISCVFLKPKKDHLFISGLQKHIARLRDFTDAQPVLWLDAVRGTQRSNLVRNRIAFIVPDLQLYLPFLYIYFKEEFISPPTHVDHFTASVQEVYLWLLIHPRDYYSAVRISAELNLSAMTASRALRDIEELELITMQGSATRKKYRRIKKEKYWHNGLPYLISPVIREINVRKLPLNINVYLSGDSALARNTMLNAPSHPVYASNKKSLDKIPVEDILQPYDLDDVDYIILELWKYDPGLFSKTETVDPFSLYISMRGQDDPRLDIEFEEIMKEVLCED